ncbi:pyrimidodiazepine synthase-like [Amphiura filiformis]|uniref:pyrimidodiazepine synthase-like n=1 Tax=Amphiura filiformis TaxID=82378 RepID=UPI003B21B103
MLCRTLRVLMISRPVIMTNRATQRLRQLEESLLVAHSSMSNMSNSAVGMSTTNAVLTTTRHLAKGDSLPPQNDGTLRLFSMKYCPYALRARLVLAAKGIQYETINCNLKNKPEFLLERNPKGLVPVLEYKGHVVIESLIVCDLLDELYPQRPLYPTNPFSKAKDKVTIHFFDSFTNLLRKMLKYREDFAPDQAVKFFDGLQRMEKDLQSRGTAFYSGIEPGMVDYMCWPWLERLSWSPQAGGVLSNYPTIKAYIERMHQDDAVKAVYIPSEEVNTFYNGLFTGNAVYDL